MVLVLLINLLKVVSNQFVVVSLADHDFPGLWLAVVFGKLHVIERRVGKHRKLLAEPLAVPFIQPLMLLAVAFELAL